MRKEITKINELRRRRAQRNRQKLRGTPAKPRLCVIKSNKHIQVQLIDDEAGITLASTSTFSKEFRKTEFNKRNKASAAKLGEKIAALATEKNIREVVFDRGAAKYHGVLASLADSARTGGLKF